MESRAEGQAGRYKDTKENSYYERNFAVCAQGLPYYVGGEKVHEGHAEREDVEKVLRLAAEE